MEPLQVICQVNGVATEGWFNIRCIILISLKTIVHYLDIQMVITGATITYVKMIFSDDRDFPTMGTQMYSPG